ncbi:hypothetical protein SAY87_011387 [Trapa incisa]|uniref:Uncharacterized protein n=1 Tax=Trapa incisa TaxID=236973 RepID=A0AAN7JJ29_9MYRT|nr:hypothetical protein SAY87_011387 [Trapa incisa]
MAFWVMRSRPFFSLAPLPQELSCPEQWESVPYSLKMDKKMLVLWFTWAMVPPVRETST